MKTRIDKGVYLLRNLIPEKAARDTKKITEIIRIVG